MPRKIDPKDNPGSTPPASPVGRAALWGQALGYSKANTGPPPKKMIPVAGRKEDKIKMAKAAAARLRGNK